VRPKKPLPPSTTVPTTTTTTTASNNAAASNSNALAKQLETSSLLRENGEDLPDATLEWFMDRVKQADGPPQRLSLVLSTLAPAMWLPKDLLQASDVLAGDAERNFAVLTYWFCTSPTGHDDAHYALCNDLKSQLASVKTKWRELREAAATTTASSSSSTMPAEKPGVRSAKLKLVVAQTVELKRKLDIEDSKLRDGHALWYKSLRIVLRKFFASYARVARGLAGIIVPSDARHDETDGFGKLPSRARLADLELAHEDAAWEYKQLQFHLRAVHGELARIYRSYATRSGDTSNQFITAGDFVELVTECKIVDSLLFSSNDLMAILRKLDPKLVRGGYSLIGTWVGRDTSTHVCIQRCVCVLGHRCRRAAHEKPLADGVRRRPRANGPTQVRQRVRTLFLLVAAVLLYYYYSTWSHARCVYE
jgi:hypothetical protein